MPAHSSVSLCLASHKPIALLAKHQPFLRMKRTAFSNYKILSMSVGSIQHIILPHRFVSDCPLVGNVRATAHTHTNTQESCISATPYCCQRALDAAISMKPFSIAIFAIAKWKRVSFTPLSTASYSTPSAHIVSYHRRPAAVCYIFICRISYQSVHVFSSFPFSSRLPLLLSWHCVVITYIIWIINIYYERICMCLYRYNQPPTTGTNKCTHNWKQSRRKVYIIIVIRCAMMLMLLAVDCCSFSLSVCVCVCACVFVPVLFVIFTLLKLAESAIRFVRNARC